MSPLTFSGHERRSYGHREGADVQSPKGRGLGRRSVGSRSSVLITWTSTTLVSGSGVRSPSDRQSVVETFVSGPTSKQGTRGSEGRSECQGGRHESGREFPDRRRYDGGRRFVSGEGGPRVRPDPGKRGRGSRILGPGSLRPHTSR